MVALNVLAGVITVGAVAVVTVLARKTRRRVEVARHQQRTLITWAQQMTEWRDSVEAEIRSVKAERAADRRRITALERKVR